MSTTTTTDPLTLVAEATAALTTAHDELDRANAARDDAIRAAIERGARVVDLVQATGLHRNRIYQIRDGVR